MRWLAGGARSEFGMEQADRERIVAETQRALDEGQLALAQFPRAADLVERVVAGEALADEFRWVGDAVIYDVEDGWPVLYLALPESNPILRRPMEASVALAEYGLFPLADPDELQAVKTHPSTARALIVELDLKVGGDCCWPTTRQRDREGPKSDRRDAKHPHFHLEVEDNAAALNPAQRRVAEALFGAPLESYLGWLRERRVFQTKIMTLWQGGVVARHARHGPFSMGARLSEIFGHWEVDGNMLLSCDGILGRHWDVGRPSTLPPP